MIEAAVDAYAEVARRWETSAVVPELAFALLGHGRSLLAIGRRGCPTVARAGRTIFKDLRAAPALEEIDAAILALDALPA